METRMAQASGTGEPPDYTELMEAADDFEDNEEMIEESDSDDTEADENAWPKGSGPRGRGQPLQVGSFEKRRELVDGAGLCSLGKWPPAQRPEQPSERIRSVREILMHALSRWRSDQGHGVNHLFGRLSRGEVPEDPFGEVFVESVRLEVLRVLDP